MSQTKNSSTSTILALLNSMIGGTMLTMPILFLKSGIVTGVLVLIISGFVSYKTCRIYVLHLAKKDNDVEDSIGRILNAKWQKFFKLITGYYLVCLNVIYIELIVDQIYDVIYFILGALDHSDWIAQKGIKQLVFDRFSIQYLSLICFLPLLSMIFIKDLSFLVKLTAAGSLSVAIYMLFIVYQFFSSLSTVNWEILPWVSTDLGNLAGSCAIAFTIHTVVASIIKKSEDQSKNERDLKISYLLGLLTYVFIGIAGCIAILGNKACKVTIIDCFLDDWRTLLVEVSYLLGLLTVYPCFLEVGRSRLLLTYFPEIKPKQFRLFNLSFMIIATTFTFLSPFLPLDLIMNLVGSIFCFFFVYLIPYKMHIQCLYRRSSHEQTESLLSSQTDQKQLQQNNCPHDKDQGLKQPKNLRNIFYLALNFLGVAVGLYGIYQFIEAIQTL